MILNKKILLSLGGILVATTPVIAIASCSSSVDVRLFNLDITSKYSNASFDQSFTMQASDWNTLSENVDGTFQEDKSNKLIIMTLHLRFYKKFLL